VPPRAVPYPARSSHYTSTVTRLHNRVNTELPLSVADFGPPIAPGTTEPSRSGRRTPHERPRRATLLTAAATIETRRFVLEAIQALVARLDATEQRPTTERRLQDVEDLTALLE
jgi:hypothetical protein